MEEKIVELIDEMLDATKNDTRYGIWVQDAQNKNEDVRIYTLIDLRNYLKNSAVPNREEVS